MNGEYGSAFVRGFQFGAAATPAHAPYIKAAAVVKQLQASMPAPAEGATMPDLQQLLEQHKSSIQESMQKELVGAARARSRSPRQSQG